MDNNDMSQFKELARELSVLNTVKAPRELHVRIDYWVSLLEDRQRRFVWFPKPAFARSFVIALLFILLTGGGIVAAATKSEPGDVLYPLKQFITSIVTRKEKNGQESAVPQPPSPTPTSSVQEQPSDAKKNKSPNNNVVLPDQSLTVTKPVEEIIDDGNETTNEIEETIDDVLELSPTVVPSTPPTGGLPVNLEIDAEVQVAGGNDSIADVDAHVGPINLNLKLGL